MAGELQDSLFDAAKATAQAAKEAAEAQSADAALAFAQATSHLIGAASSAPLI